MALGEILTAIADAGEIELRIDAPLPEQRTVERHRVPVPDLVSDLLRDRSFVFRTGESLWVPSDHRANRAGRQELAPTDYPHPLELAAVETLLDEDVRDLATLERLGAIADSDAPTAVREEALIGLAEFGAAALPILEEALAFTVPRLQEAAIDALSDIGGDGAAWALAGAVDDRNREIREAVLYALSDIGGEIAVLLLERSLADPDPELRQLAAELRDEIPDDERDS